jgi:DNA repair exonuclease SbcCD ATPase subunit
MADVLRDRGEMAAWSAFTRRRRNCHAGCGSVIFSDERELLGESKFLQALKESEVQSSNTETDHAALRQENEKLREELKPAAETPEDRVKTLEKEEDTLLAQLHKLGAEVRSGLFLAIFESDQDRITRREKRVNWLKEAVQALEAGETPPKSPEGLELILPEKLRKQLKPPKRTSTTR